MNDLISRQAAIDIFDDYNVSVENGELEAYRRDRKRLCELPTIQPEERAEKRMETHACDLISRQEVLDALDNQIKRCCKALGSFSLSDVDTHAVKVEMASLRAYREMLENLPTVQPEPTYEQVLDYCKKRCLHIVTADVFQSTHLTHKVRFGDKDHVWIDSKQYISLPRFQEAVKEAEPKKGYWKKDETDDCPPIFQQFRICSECGAIETAETKFCPSCGARMGEKRNV